MYGAEVEAISRLKHVYIVGSVCTGRQGLGLGEVGVFNRFDNVDCKERKKMVTDELRNVEEEKRMAKTVGMTSQAAWIKLKRALPRKIISKTLLKIEPIRSQFICLSYDLLP